MIEHRNKSDYNPVLDIYEVFLLHEWAYAHDCEENWMKTERGKETFHLQMVEAFKTLVTFDAFVFSILTMGQFVFGQRTFIGEYLSSETMRKRHELIDRLTLLQSGCAQKCRFTCEWPERLFDDFEWYECPEATEEIFISLFNGDRRVLSKWKKRTNV